MDSKNSDIMSYKQTCQVLRKQFLLLNDSPADSYLKSDSTQWYNIGRISVSTVQDAPGSERGRLVLATSAASAGTDKHGLRRALSPLT